MSNKLSTSSTLQIRYQSIANGYTDIATYLGHRPENVFFMHSLVTDPTNSHDMKFCATDDLDIRGIQYSVGLMGPDSNAFHFPADSRHEDYLAQHVIRGNLIQVAPVSSERLHPGGSMPAAIMDAIAKKTTLGRSLAQKISGSTLVNSYVTKEFEQLCFSANAGKIMDADTYLPFVSKAYVHHVADKANLTIAPGIVFEEPAFVETYTKAIGTLKKQHQTKNSEVWIKAAALSGGQGIVKIDQINTNTVGHAFRSIAQGYKGAGFFDGKSATSDEPFHGIDYFMPIVAELDIGSLPSIKKIVLNSCVQAVVGPQAITMTGTTLQQTINGEYVGGITPLPEHAESVAAAEEEAIKFLKQTHKDGYRGYGGVDVIVGMTHDDEMVAHVLEFNPRLNASTPLLALTQHSKKQTGAAQGKICGHSIPGRNGSVSDIYDKIIGNDLYRGEETNYRGVIPTMIDVVAGRDTGFRLVTIGENISDIEETYQRITRNIKKLSI